MRRLLLLTLAAIITFALAVPAHAGVDCAEKPNHPACDSEPLTAGTVCGTTPPETGVFEVMLGGRHTEYTYPPGMCIDVLSAAGEWTVSVEVLAGTLRELNLYLRDSFAPGDGCFEGGSCGLALRDISSEPGVITEIELGHMPDAHVNACGLQYGELVEVDAELVYFDTVEPSIESPLAFMPSMRASNDAVVKLSVHMPSP